MKNIPLAPNQAEIKEIAALKEIQKIWMAADAGHMEEMLNGLYLAKFAFSDAGSAYIGDLFLIQSDYLDGDYQVIRLIRKANKKLKVLV